MAQSLITVLIGLAALVPGAVEAQMDRSSIRGTVTDPQGNRVPKAAVRARQLSTGWERVAETTSQGTYAIEDLPIGLYSIAVSGAGFTPFRTERVQQHIGQVRTLDVQLSVARASEEATITENLIKLDRSDAVLGAPIEQAQLYYLPLNGRNWAALTALVPGAIDSGTRGGLSLSNNYHLGDV